MIYDISFFKDYKNNPIHVLDVLHRFPCVWLKVKLIKISYIQKYLSINLVLEEVYKYFLFTKNLSLKKYINIVINHDIF